MWKLAVFVRLCAILSWHFDTAIASGRQGCTSSHKSAEFTPRTLALGSAPQLQAQGLFTSFTLDIDTPVVTLDYGIEVAGYPFFAISSLSGPVQVEVKYSEPFTGLEAAFSDGPYNFVTTLANTFRVETFNFTDQGTITSSLLQGGQRWQSLKLLTEGSISFSQIGFNATISTDRVDQLPGQFESSSDTLDAIWKLGARAVTAACVDAGTQHQVWEVDPVSGVYARSVRPALSSNGTLLSDYTLEFDTKIARGGSWWSVAGDTSYLNAAYTLLLVGSLPAATTFVNHNYSLFPANSILLAYGYDFVNQTSLDSWLLDVFEVPFEVDENAWHHITTDMSSTDYLSVSINTSQVFNVSLTTYPSATGALTGSFGFGAYQDQEAYFRNVLVTNTTDGSELYINTLNTDGILVEYGTQANTGTLCLDGAKRDRLVWLGDFYHTSRIIPVSTTRTDHSRGTLQFLLDTQLPDGELSINPGLGYDPSSAYPSFYPAGLAGLQDYQILSLIAFAHHVGTANDITWAQSTWPGWQKQMDWLLGTINATDGLIYLNSAFLGPSTGGSAISCAAVQALNSVADVAIALNDSASETSYRKAAESLQEAINAQLWNEAAGIYALSPNSFEDFSVAGTAFCITSGVADANQTAALANSIEQLRLGPGYKDSSQVNGSDPTVNISPNTNGFLLEALFTANATDQALSLVTDLWGAMLPGPGIQNETASGASWEYVRAATGEPGLSLFTSLSHPWGGATTYLLTEWAAGLKATEGPSGFGFQNWVVTPETGLRMGLKSANAQVVTAFGGPLRVEWAVEGQKLQVKIQAPAETTGTFRFGGLVKTLVAEQTYEFDIDI
ncbi:Six-hairpin glycosidase-like protein [Xylariales sp. PMI_506]|nr:Six-hairpin glycosidase-like protein [Xylariales sp. PMI_506]